MKMCGYMGGAKKKSLVSAEKQQNLRDSKQNKEKSSKSRKETYQNQEYNNLPDISDKDLTELKKMKSLTLYSIAIKYNVKLSIAKSLLKTLKARNVIQLVVSSGGRKVYKVI